MGCSRDSLLMGLIKAPFMSCPHLTHDHCHHASLFLYINNYIKNIVVSVYKQLIFCIILII